MHHGLDLHSWLPYAAVALWMCSLSAGAQTTGGEASPPGVAPRGNSARSEVLEEITVTATRRESRLLDTPISLSVLSATDIQRNRVVSMDDVAQQVPGFTYIPQSGSETYLAIRGAATIDDSSGTDQGVSMFVDDVVRVSVADLQPELFDMERVEVLKGPQGTLFGRNAIGGIVALYTKNPTFTTEAGTELTYGNYNTVEVKALFNTPLIDDKLAARVVVSRHTNDGYIQDVTTHNYLGNDDSWAMRAKLLFAPSEAFRFVGTVDSLWKHGSDPTWLLGNFKPALDPGLTYNPLQTAQGSPGRIGQTIWGLTGRADWTIEPGVLTSITGYRHLDVFDESVITADPRDTTILATTSNDHQLTEELRLASPVERKLTWVAGLYYLNSNRTRPYFVPQNIIPGSYLETIVGIVPQPVTFTVAQDTRTISDAAFADVTYAITQSVKLNLGGRYTREQKSGHSAINLSGIVNGPPISAVYSHSWSAFTPKATLIYQPDPAFMSYATISKGFQSGGYNTAGSTDQALATPFNSEFLWNYEAGVKFSGWNHRLEASVSAFTDRFSELQIVEFNDSALTFVTRNAGTAKVNGLETVINAAPANWLTLGVKYDYLNAVFTNYVLNNGPGVPPTVNTGNRVPFAPPSAVTASAELHSPSQSDRAHLAFGIEYAYRSPMELTAANDIPQFLRSRTAQRGVINFHASWTSKDDKWEVVFWGKNVTNLHFIANAGDEAIYLESPDESNNPDNHVFDSHLAFPRSYGVTLRTKLR